MPLRVCDALEPLPLHDSAASRAIEAAALAASAPHALMARAGLATARVALALAPGAACVTVLAGPGNNGGDGLVAACHLRQAGKQVRVLHLVDDPARMPADAAHAWQQARALDLDWAGSCADLGPSDLVIDGLLGLGAAREPSGAIAQALDWCRHQSSPILSIDLPTGLHADTGRVLGAAAIAARWTLALLTLKPGLVTGAGRDHVGELWLDDLGVRSDAPPSAWLVAMRHPPPLAWAPRHHAQHKGSFGDVIVIGGAPGMSGAAWLAAHAALAAGAGRVYLSPLDGAVQPPWPELMLRQRAWDDAAALAASTVVCGCGGGAAVADTLPAVLGSAARLVLDADGLNAVAADGGLRAALHARAQRGQATVLTPHPLEAARLLGVDAADVQADRLAAARRLAESSQAVVLLKGSGTVIAEPGQPAVWINGSGNARLATAGSGDVLAGWIGGNWSQRGTRGSPAVDAGSAARSAAWRHGHAADAMPGAAELPLRAGELIERMAEPVPGA